MEHSPEPGPSKKTPRRYAFACSNCRKKKIRCDGAQPECRSCIKAEEVCQYPKKRMEAQLAQAQKRIQELESELSAARSNSPYGSQVGSSPGAFYSDSEQDYSLYAQIGFDERGSLTYHGPTSRYHGSSFEDPDDLDPAEEIDKQRERLREGCQREFKTNHDYLFSVWQPSVLNKTEADFGIPVDLANHLFSAYFQWQNTFYNFVYKTEPTDERPAFMRDVALEGPYCSRFLLTSMFALAARHCSHDSPVYRDKGERFLAAAKELLVQELGSARPAITTIQGLLILGSRQCAVGNTSEGWLFSGMAFRMMADIGLHLDAQKLSKYEQYNDTDIEVRKRTALAACIWDKMLALTLGRPPSLPRIATCPDDIFDEFDDRDYWQPLACESLDNYRAARSYTTSTFKHLAYLSEIIPLVQAIGSSPGQSRISNGQIESVQNRLEFWYSQLPTILRIDDPASRAVCPPPHVLSLNLLYRTLLVILFRSYLSPAFPARSAVKANGIEYLCEHAAMLHHLFTLYGRTFRYKAITYLISYCIYSVATVDVSFIRCGNEVQRHGAALRLRASLKVLENESKSTSSIKRSVDIIKKQIKTAAIEREQEESRPRSSRQSSQPMHEQPQFGFSAVYSHPHAAGAAAATAHEFAGYTQQRTPQPQYFGDYSGHYQGGQQHMPPPEGQHGWNPAMAGGYDPNAYDWNLDESMQASLAGQGSMFGQWPPNSSMP